MKTFLQPLTAKEETYYLQKYQEGDLTAKDILIEHNLRLVAHVVKKYQGLDDDPDDLISIGTIGLIKAVATFDAGKATRLSTYAARCIDNELLMMLRLKKKKNKEVSLYEPIGTDKEGNEINLLDIIETPPIDVVEKCTLKENVRQLATLLRTTLTPTEYEILILRYGLYGQQEFTQREIGKRLLCFPY